MQSLRDASSAPRNVGRFFDGRSQGGPMFPYGIAAFFPAEGRPPRTTENGQAAKKEKLAKVRAYGNSRARIYPKRPRSAPRIDSVASNLGQDQIVGRGLRLVEVDATK